MSQQECSKIKRITSKVIRKYTDKGINATNIAIDPAFMFFDFPFKRPVYYHLVLENGVDKEVDESTYDEYQVGNSYSYIDDTSEKVEDFSLFFVGIIFACILVVITVLILVKII